MRTSVLANLIPRHVGAISPVIAPTAPIPAAIASPFTAEPVVCDEVRVTAQLLPDGRLDEPQVRFQFNDGVQVGDETVIRTFKEHHKKVQEYFESARQAREEHDWEKVRFWYTSLLGALTATVDAETARPSEYFRHFSNGEDVFVESVIGVAVFAGPGDSISMLNRLGLARRMLKLRRAGEHGGEMTRLDGDLTRVKIMRANAIMRYADNVDEYELACDRADEFGLIGRASIEAPHEFYENAEGKLNAGLKLIDIKAHKDHPATHYVGKLLLVDVLVRQADCSFWRGDPDKERKEIFDKLENAARDTTSGYAVLGSKGLETAASYIADVATLFMRMNAINRALKLARMLTDQSSDFAETDHAKALLQSVDFEDLAFESLADNGRVEILSNYQLRTRPGSKPLLNRTEATLANAHSKGFWESVAVDTAGAIVAGGAAHLLGAQPSTVVPLAMAGAGLARMGMSVWNGWFSEEATSVGQTGLYDSSGRGVVGDVARLLGTGALHTGAMAPVAGLGIYFPEWFPMAKNTFGLAWDFFTDRIFDSNTYSNASLYPQPDTYMHDFLWYVARPLAAATAAYQLAYMLSPQSVRNKQTSFSNRNYVWPFLLTGALFLSADLSMVIAGKTDFVDRIGRGVIGIGAASAMLMMGGIIALGKTGSRNEFLSSLWNGFKELDKMTLVSAAVMTGVTSAIGGHMEKSAQPDNVFLRFLHGALINMVVLPLPILISGTFKRYYNPFRGAKEGWQDAKGEGAVRVAYETAKGFLAAFWVPYFHNRPGRATIPWYDWLGAGVRREIAWDTNPGTLAMSAINIGTTDSAGTITWPETGRTDWERNAFKELFGHRGAGKAADTTARAYDFWRKAGQRMSPRHWTYPHTIRDRLWQFAAIKRVWSPPKFPLYPNAHHFAGSLLQLMGKHAITLTAEEVDRILEIVKTLAEHPRNYAVMRPVVQTLYAARARDTGAGGAKESAGPHGPQIWRFFRDNPWIIDLLNVDRATFTPHDTKHRSSLGFWAIRTLKLNRSQYTRRVREHRALKGRVHDENEARNEAKKWAKEKRKEEKRGSWDEQKAKIMQELNKKGHVDLRRLEIALLGAKNNLYQGNGEDKVEKRNEQIRKLARKMARKNKRSEVSLEKRQADVEMFLRMLDDETIWVQQLFLMSPRKAKRWRRRIVSRLAGVILTNRRQQERVEKEVELLREVAAKYATEEKKAERPIYGLFDA